MALPGCQNLASVICFCQTVSCLQVRPVLESGEPGRVQSPGHPACDSEPLATLWAPVPLG